MDLFKLSLPGIMPNTESLYIRTNGNVSVNVDSIELEKGSSVSTDTYFNIFSSSKYSEYTNVQDVIFKTTVSGAMRINLHRCTLESDEIITTETICSETSEDVSLQFNINGLSEHSPVCHYVSFEAEEDSKIIDIGSFSSDVQENDVKLAIVICTYNREEYLKKNVKSISETLFDSKYHTDDVSLYVIDNGRTLKSEDVCKHPNVKLIPNRNLGGSGGFARGMMEAFDDGMTHVILMDDDIVIDPNVIYKNLNILKTLKESKKDAFILGGMISLENPTIQYEAGSRYNGRFVQLKGDLDLSIRGSLFKNDLYEDADYGAWWYMCAPLKNENALPMPFFIKMDDVEYGLRNMSQHIIINGIGVWHEDFENKRNRIAERYYHERNSMMVKSIHNMKDWTFMPRFWHTIFSDIASKDYSSISFYLKAISDYLESQNSGMTEDGAELHEILREINTAPDDGTYPKERRSTNIAKELFKPRFWRTIFLSINTFFKYYAKRSEASKKYREVAENIVNRKTWEERLNLEDEHNNL